MNSPVTPPYCVFHAVLFTVGLCCLLASGPATAVRASLSVDLNSGAILNAHRPTTPSRPASLAKLMTLYLLLDAVQKGELAMDSPLSVSPRAAAQPATRLGLRGGDTLAVEDAIKALMVRSANDVAVVIAEAVASTEAAFVQRMNKVGHFLGLTGTYFANASGLPAANARTTARDMAVITTALYARFSDYAGYFGLKTVTVKGRSLRTHHRLLTRYEGAIGLKTGFTCKAGYNSVTVVKKGTRLIASIVLGAASPARRASTAAWLLDAGFALAGPGEVPGGAAQTLAHYSARSKQPLNRQNIATHCNAVGKSGRMNAFYRASGWSIELEPLITAEAKTRARRVRKLAPEGRILLLPVAARQLIHRAGLTGLKQARAVKVCRQLRAAGQYCVVRSPESMAALSRRAQLAFSR
ncbi:MAG: hypothetical protein GKR94_07095 [Gammaproteobacteria bacterium]|nr:hypothetical protein [Gammaproteobacteria bacterium]